MIRRALALTVTLLALSGGDAWAHASLEASEPATGATLGAAPRVVRLTFSELPDPSLSTVRVLRAGGDPVQFGAASPVDGDPKTLAVGVRPLEHGVYTVRYRAVSSDDGHVSAGIVTFGVGVTPGETSIARSEADSPAALEVAARVALIAGLILLLGAAVAGAARFGGDDGSDVGLAAGGWVLAAAGLLALTVAQARGSGTPVAALLDSPAGHGLLSRTGALAACGAGVAIAWQLPGVRRGALAATTVAALGAIAAHIASGHAGTSSARVLFGVLHFGAAGVWMGGLVALLVGVRGAPSDAKATAVRRFSRLAGASLGLLMVSGLVRALEELPTAGALISSQYGHAIAAKTLLVVVVVAIAWRNRTRSVPVAGKALAPLRRRSRFELTVALGALIAAGTMGSVAPPVVAHPPAPALSVTASDAGHSIRVRLTAASREPGPNAFTARVQQEHGPPPVGVRLRFTALDDPEVAPTMLRLHRAPGDGFVGTGGNLSFEGRWRIDVLVGRRTGTIDAPADVSVQAPDQRVSVLRPPGRAPEYTRMLRGLGYLRVAPHRRPTGLSPVVVSVFDVFEGEADVKQLFLSAPGDRTTRRLPVRRLGPGRFLARAALGSGPALLSVVARRTDGSRMRALFTIDPR